MALVLDGASIAIFLYLVLLLGRILFSWIMHLAPDWRPRGLSLIATETCFAATDPPIRALRGILPTINAGNFRIDLAVPALFLGLYIALNLLLAARNA